MMDSFTVDELVCEHLAQGNPDLAKRVVCDPDSGLSGREKERLLKLIDERT